MTIKQELQSIEELGGVYVEIEEKFNRADYTEVLEKQPDKLRKDHADYFAKAQDATGQAWPPLAPSTVKRKGHATILVEHGDLQASLVGQGGANIAEVTHRGVNFGTSDEKAPFHQSGTSRMPARPAVGITEERVDAVANEVADFLVEQLKFKI